MMLLVPLYVHPAEDPDAWRRLAEAAADLYGVVLNAADGPGEFPDPAFTGPVEALRAAGVRVLGYVDLDYGARPADAVVRDIERHRAWYGADGFFLDRAPADRTGLPFVRRVARAARRAGGTSLVLNPGVHPAPEYLKVADLIVTFEGHWSTYVSTFTRPGWADRQPPERLCHLVYGVPDAFLALALRTTGERGAGVCCVVGRELPNPWAALPPVLPGKTP
ncbi:spherulation-specific family 4 protein [Streptomyces sp. NBC_00083]|uniref:spherulation-specific family 4 protein n=1 Tax=Streptomyces sp. NBC_00083 TaxID=2975647 RepID=UPI0022570A77|nr:spherulation-specific family 4 protein [Streptomyces sp. NBC_00083]MCX5386952.1 spherulation-specific family 4 protein [Streptomyces sp. NBC_00083]